MQHLYCQETATESYIKCIMCTARVGNDDVPNIQIKHVKNPNLLGLKLYFGDRRDTVWHQTISKTTPCSLPHCFISSSSSCLQVCQNWENHLIKNVTDKEWSLGAKLCGSSQTKRDVSIFSRDIDNLIARFSYIQYCFDNIHSTKDVIRLAGMRFTCLQ